MSLSPSYSDNALALAVAQSRSWRGVLRTLGFSATSGSAIRAVRQRADSLHIDHSHFIGQRRWTDKQFAAAVRASDSWSQVADALGLRGGSWQATFRAHAVRLSLDTGHLQTRGRVAATPVAVAGPALAHLPRAGSMLAAAWFALSGYDVSWPLEPCRYDLLVVGDEPMRVQVKTGTVRENSSWVTWLSSTGTVRRVYDPDEIDYFFVIDGSLDYYLIPVAVVGGYHVIHLSAYEQYRLPHLKG